MKIKLRLKMEILKAKAFECVKKNIFFKINIRNWDKNKKPHT